MSSVYLIHDLGDRLDQAAVLLSHKAVPPLLLLQGLLVAHPEELHVVTAAILWTHRILSQKRCGEDLLPSSQYEREGEPGFSTAASPERPPGCGPPSRSASCCPARQRINVTLGLSRYLTAPLCV